MATAGDTSLETTELSSIAPALAFRGPASNQEVCIKPFLSHEDTAPPPSVPQSGLGIYRDKTSQVIFKNGEKPNPHYLLDDALCSRKPKCFLVKGPF